MSEASQRKCRFCGACKDPSEFHTLRTNLCKDCVKKTRSDRYYRRKIERGHTEDRRKHSKRKLDLTGQRFGCLTAVASELSRNGTRLWECRCDCGNTVNVATGDLRASNRRHCVKCAEVPDQTGEKYGRLTILQDYLPDHDERTVLCQCECGEKRKFLLNTLRSGKSVSCGCYRSECAKLLGLSKRKQGKSKYEQRQFTLYRRGAERRGLDFTLTLAEFTEITSKPCFYCGQAPSPFLHYRRGNEIPPNFSGVDRADNTKGYHLDNCVPCCKACNLMKGSLPRETFMGKIEAIWRISRGKEAAK